MVEDNTPRCMLKVPSEYGDPFLDARCLLRYLVSKMLNVERSLELITVTCLTGTVPV